MNSTLKEIIVELKDAQATSKVILEDVEPAVRAGVEGKIRQSERLIGQLKNRYRSEISRRLYIVAAKGKYSADFAEKARSKVMCVDNGFATNLLAKRISAKSRFDSFGGQELIMLRGELNNFQREFDLSNIPPIQDHNLAQLVAHLPLRDAIETVLTKNFGYQIHSAIIRRHVADLALENLHEASNLVVVIYNYVGTDDSLLPPPAITLDFSEEVTEDKVAATLEEIKKGIRSQNLKKAKKNPSQELGEEKANG
jgi:hypothetical protein